MPGPRDAPPRTASVVIIGGGVIGTSCAFHLAEAGARGVVLVERGQLGSGSTSRAAGGVRAQFSDMINIMLAQRSLAAFADFGRRPGWEIGLQRVGYLFVLTREQDVETFQRSVALQHLFDVPSRMIDPGTVRALSPLLRVDDVLAGAFSPSDGHATPDAVVQGYAAGARALGARLATGCEVDRDRSARQPDREGRHDQRDDSDRRRRLRGGGVVAPVRCARRCRAPRDAAAPHRPVHGIDAGAPRRLPMTIDFATSFYFHREGPGVLMGMAAPGEQPRLGRSTARTSCSRALLEVAERRAPRSRAWASRATGRASTR